MEIATEFITYDWLGPSAAITWVERDDVSNPVVVKRDGPDARWVRLGIVPTFVEEHSGSGTQPIDRNSGADRCPCCGR